jgi:thiol-disulfide isomerase/thioredoxin
MKKFFKHVAFEEDTHTYTINGKKAGISTTGLIHNYCIPFDENKIAPFSAEKQGKTVKEILDEWAYKREYACCRGNEVHLYSQGLWNGIPYKTDYFHIDIDFLEQLQYELPILQKQALSFYNQYKDLYEFVEEEQFLYDAEYDVAGSIDLLLKNKSTGEYAIVDFKTYGDLHKKAYNKFLIPLQKFWDNNTNHLSFQLEVYKQIFERETKLVVGEMFGVYFNIGIDDYEIIEVNDMGIEAKKILENRRIQKMKSVPVLLIGKSGSGKSTSLRNFNKDEVAVVNVLGKPLPFKTDINAPRVDDYKVILQAIAKTDKKVIFIDDANYLITKEFMDKRSVKGYEKFNEMGGNFYDLINGIKNVEGGKTVYLAMHEESDEYGNVQPKTIGKMLNDKVNIQGMFTICIRSMFENGNYIFRLKTNGQDCVKTPFDMTEDTEMGNDLKEFDTMVRDYYELDKKVKKSE